MFCVIVGDIIQSKNFSRSDRYESTVAVNKVLEDINQKYSEVILADFGIVRGDGFEGVLYSQRYVPQIAQEIIRKLYLKDEEREIRIKVRISAVMDDLSVISSDRNRADGKAFYTAMQKIEELRKNNSEHWLQISMETKSVAQPIVDSLLALLTAMTSEWTEKQTEIVFGMKDVFEQQNRIAEKLQISTSVVYKQLKAAQYDVYTNAWKDLEQYFMDYEEMLVNPSVSSPSYATYYSIAIRHNEIRDYEGAIKYFKDALRLAQESLGENKENLVPIYNGLAEAYLEKISYSDENNEERTELLKHVKKSIDESLNCQKELAIMRLEYAQTLKLQGNYYIAKEQYDEAVTQYERAREIVENSQGKDHPLVYDCYNNIAVALTEKRNFEQALEYYQKDLVYAEKNKKNKPLNYADSMYNIGICYGEMKDYPKAMEMLEKAKEVYSSILPPKHAMIAKVLKKINGMKEIK